MSKPIKFYTKEETKKILDLFAERTPRKEIEKYAKSIGRTFNELKQKRYYEVTKINGGKAGNSSKPWSDGELNFLVENWRNFSNKQRRKYAKSQGRSYGACEKMFYKNRKKPARIQKAGDIQVTHLEKKQPARLTAVVRVGDVTVELPNTANQIQINGNTIVW